LNSLKHTHQQRQVQQLQQQPQHLQHLPLVDQKVELPQFQNLHKLRVLHQLLLNLQLNQLRP
jgi:hypothetical protein